MRNESADGLIAIVKVTPPALITGASYVMGMSLQDWVYALTALYTLIMIGQHAYDKWVRPWLSKRRK
jgi:hypothetical protein